MALDPNREEKLRQKYMPPDPTTQSSMQYAKSLLAQKDERDNEAFERSKKNAKKYEQSEEYGNDVYDEHQPL